MKLEVKFIFIALMIIASCTRNGMETLSPDDYVNFMEDESNGFRKKVVVGENSYTFQMKSPEYIACKEHQVNPDEEIAARVNQLGSTIWFNIYLSSTKGNESLLKKGVSGMDEYNSRLSYFLNTANSQFRCINDGAQMENVGYLFENNYGVTPYDVIIIGFKVTHPDKGIVLEYVDGLFNDGIIKVKIDHNKLSALPKVST